MTRRCLATHSIISVSSAETRVTTRALEYYQKSLALSEQLNDKRLGALLLNNIGRFYRDQGDYKRALENYQQSLAIREKLDDQSGMAYVLIHIGTLHYL